MFMLIGRSNHPRADDSSTRRLGPFETEDNARELANMIGMGEAVRWEIVPAD